MKNERRYYNIPEKPEYVRDSHSKGLILKDQSVLLREKSNRRRKEQQEQLRKDVDALKTQMDRIESLLLQNLKKE